MNINETDEMTIVNALRVAAEQYAKDADAVDDGSDDVPEVTRRLAAQFRRQCFEAREVAARIENEGLAAA